MAKFKNILHIVPTGSDRCIKCGLLRDDFVLATDYSTPVAIDAPGYTYCDARVITASGTSIYSTYASTNYIETGKTIHQELEEMERVLGLYDEPNIIEKIYG